MIRNNMAFACLLLYSLANSTIDAQVDEFGIHVPSLDLFDTTMQSFMTDRGIDAGVLAVSQNGVIVYQRGFGTPENTPMRVASVSKPITAAAIHALCADGLLELDDRVFALGGTNGILPHTPWNGLGDARLGQVTVNHLLDHLGGWDFDAPLGNPPFIDNGNMQQGDPQFLTVDIALRMGVDPPPANRDQIIQFMLSEPLQFTPGNINDGQCLNPRINNGELYCYNNFGYMVLGRIVEEITGLSPFEYIRSRVITPEIWVPNQEIILGRSLFADRNPREPIYQCPDCYCLNVFDYQGEPVPCAYGGIHLEAFQGHGNLVLSAVPLLRFMENYTVGIQDEAGLPWTPGSFGVFTGAFVGTNATIVQRSDGINIAVLLSRQESNTSASIAQFVSDLIDNANPVFPTFAVDGYWVDFNAPAAPIEVGGFDHPFRTVDDVLDVGDGAKIRLKPGTTSWTGTISNQVLIDAPFGPATIGG